MQRLAGKFTAKLTYVTATFRHVTERMVATRIILAHSTQHKMKFNITAPKSYWQTMFLLKQKKNIMTRKASGDCANSQLKKLQVHSHFSGTPHSTSSPFHENYMNKLRRNALDNPAIFRETNEEIGK